MADGRIVIDTKIDQSSVGSQIDGLKKSLEKLNKLKIAPKLDTDAIKRQTEALRESVVETASKMKYAFLGAGAAIAGIFGGSLFAASTMEDIIAAFTPLTGSVDNAKKMIAAFNKEAATTPFTLTQISDVGKQLLPVLGNDIEKVTKTFRMLGDTAGGNAQKLESITKGYTKAMNKGKVDMEALNMIADAGVPIYKELADSMGITVEQMMDLSSRGAISASDLTMAFERMTSEGGIFFNGMAIASATLSGKLSTLKDNVTQSLAEIGNVFLDSAKGIIDAAISITTSFLEWAREGDNLKNALNVLIPIVSGIAAAVTTAYLAFSGIPAVVNGAKLAIAAFNAAMATNPIGLIAVAITAVLIPAIMYLWMNWEKLTALMKEHKAIAIAIIGYITVMGGAIFGIIIGLVALIKNWDTIKISFLAGMKKIAAYFMYAIGSIKNSFNILWASVKLGFFSFVDVVVNGLLSAIEKMLTVAASIPGIGEKFSSVANVAKKYRKELNDIVGDQKKSAQATIDRAKAEQKALSDKTDFEIDSIEKTKKADKEKLKQQKKADKERALSAKQAAAARASAEQATASILTEYENKIASLSLQAASGVITNQEEMNSALEETKNAIKSSFDAMAKGTQNTKVIEKNLDTLRAYKDEFERMAEAANIQKTQDEYAKNAEIIQNKIKDGLLSEEEGRQQLIDLTRQQIDSYYSLGYSAEASGDAANNAGNQATAAMKEQMRMLQLSAPMAYAVGQGVPLGIAEGIENTLHYATKAVKTLVENMAVAFSTMMAIFAGSWDILSWIADFNPSDIFDEVTSFITSVQEFFDSDLGSIPIWFNMAADMVTGLLDYIESHMPTILKTIGNVIDGILTYIADNAGAIIQQIVDIVLQIVYVILDRLPEIADQLIKAIVNLIGELAANAQDIVTALSDALIGVINSLVDNAPALLDAIISLILNLVDGIVENLPGLMEAVAKAIPAMIDALIAALPDLISGLIEAMPDIAVALIVGLTAALENMNFVEMGYALTKGLIMAAPQIAVSLAKAFAGIFTKVIPAIYRSFVDIGKYIVFGIRDGVKKWFPKVWTAIKDAFTWLIKKIKSLLGIHSPSKVFAEIGMDMIKGLIEGIKKMKNLLGLSAFSAIENMLSKLSGFVSRFYNLGKSFGSNLVSGLKSQLSGLSSTIGDWFSSAGSAIASAASSGSSLISSATSTAKKAASSVKKKIKSFFADGTNDAPGGLSLLGEEGPELVELPAHSRVYTADETKAMLSGKGLSSIKNGLASLSNVSSIQPNVSSAASNQPIVIYNTVSGSVEVSGREIGRIAFENIDMLVKGAYGY